MGVAIVLTILVAAVLRASAIKKSKSRSSRPARVLKTRPGITIRIYPATPSQNRREESLDNGVVVSGGLVLSKASSKFQILESWIKRWNTSRKGNQDRKRVWVELLTCIQHVLWHGGKTNAVLKKVGKWTPDAGGVYRRLKGRREEMDFWKRRENYWQRTGK